MRSGLHVPRRWIRLVLGLGIAISIFLLVVISTYFAALTIVITLAEFLQEWYHHRQSESEARAESAHAFRSSFKELKWKNLPQPDVQPPELWLRPDRKIMKYKQKDPLREVVRWLDQSEGSLFFLLLGPTLSGKTRLTYQLAARLRRQDNGPVVLKVRYGEEDNAWDMIQRISTRILVVVEMDEVVDADMERTFRLLDNLAESADELQSRVRVLIVARNDSFIQRANLRLGPGREIPDSEFREARKLTRGALPYPSTDSEIEKWYIQAVGAYSAARHVPCSTKKWTHIPDQHIGIVNVRALAATYSDSDEEWMRVLAGKELSIDRFGMDVVNCFAMAWVTGIKTRGELMKFAEKISPGRAEEIFDTLWRRYGTSDGIEFPPDIVSAAVAVPQLNLISSGMEEVTR